MNQNSSLKISLLGEMLQWVSMFRIQKFILAEQLLVWESLRSIFRIQDWIYWLVWKIYFNFGLQVRQLVRLASSIASAFLSLIVASRCVVYFTGCDKSFNLCRLTSVALLRKMSHIDLPMKLRKMELVSWQTKESNSKSRKQLTLLDYCEHLVMVHTDCRYLRGLSLQTDVMVQLSSVWLITTCEVQLISLRSLKLMVSRVQFSVSDIRCCISDFLHQGIKRWQSCVFPTVALKIS